MRTLVLRLLGLLVNTFRGSALTKISFLKRGYYALYTLFRPRDLTLLHLSDFKLLVNPEDEGLASFLITTGVYEPFEIDLIERVLRPGDTVLDVGANIGYHSVLLARAVGSTGQVIACEPCPDNYRLLCQNLELNNLTDRARIVECAAGQASGTARLYLNRHNRGDHRIFPKSGATQRSVEIQIQPLDDLVPSGTPVKLVKMDIQGAEWIALQGMTRILEENSDIHIFMEFWPDAMRDSGTDPSDFIDFISNNRFQACRITEGTETLSPLDSQTLQAMARSNQEYNLLLVRTASPLLQAGPTPVVCAS